jgi:hypothetical protein
MFNAEPGPPRALTHKTVDFTNISLFTVAYIHEYSQPWRLRDNTPPKRGSTDRIYTMERSQNRISIL